MDFQFTVKLNWLFNQRGLLMKNIYVCAPWRDPNSILQFKQISNKIIQIGHNPICWAVMYSPILDFSDYKNRDKGIAMGLMLMSACSELWVFGAKTQSMAQEIELAQEKGLIVVEHSLLDFLHSSR
jgi:hypothetical protein